MSERAAQIGFNLLNYRSEMSQTDLAAIMRGLGFKWSQATVWAIEKGERSLRLEEAESVARILGIGVEDLLRDEGSMEVWAYRQDIIANKDRMGAAARALVDVQIELSAESSRWSVDEATAVVMNELLSLDPVAQVAEVVADAARHIGTIEGDAQGSLVAKGSAVPLHQSLLVTIQRARELSGVRDG